MNRVVRTAAALTAGLALLPVASAGSHPGHGPPVIAVGDLSFNPASVTVVEGDYVLWSWTGPDTNHSVTADPGQTMSFDSDPGKTADQVTHKTNDGFAVLFKKAGTYTYVCKVHSFMTGRVVVQPLPANLKPQPLVAPRLTEVTVRRIGRALRVGFTVDEASSMRALIRRMAGSRPAGKVLKEIDFAGPPGHTRRSLKLGGLRKGGYQVALTAVDLSTGKTSKTVRRRFRMA